MKKTNFLIVSLSALILSGCEYDRPLCGHYRIARLNGYEVRIFRPDNSNSMVTGSVEKYAVRFPYITGYTNVKHLDLKVDTTAREGYFLLNSKTNERKEGMTIEQWRKELERIGWIDARLTDCD